MKTYLYNLKSIIQGIGRSSSEGSFFFHNFVDLNYIREDGKVLLFQKGRKITN